MSDPRTRATYLNRRLRELREQGVSTTDALRQAQSDWDATQAPAPVPAPTAPAVVPAPQPAPTPVVEPSAPPQGQLPASLPEISLAQYQEGQQLNESTASLAEARQRFLTTETTRNMQQGIPLAEARAKAIADYKRQFTRPIQQGYTENTQQRERAIPTGGPADIDVPDAKPTLLSALLPQERVGPNTDQAEQQTKVEINWDELKSSLDADDATMAGLQAAYTKHLSMNPGADEAAVLKVIFQQVADIENAPSIEDGTNEQFRQRGALAGLFGRQYRPTEVPDLNATQMAFMNSYMSSNVDAARAQVEVSYEEAQADLERRLRVADPTATSVSEDEVRQHMETMRNESVPDVPWFYNEEMKQKVVDNPDLFEKPGLFGVETMMGRRESYGSTVLRGLLSPLSAAAGVAGVVGRGALADEEIQESVREQRGDLVAYQDYPVLYNIATMDGYFGEVGRSATAREERGDISPTVANLMRTGGFVLDIFDPTLVLGVGADTGAAKATRAAAAGRGARAAGVAGARGFAAGALNELTFGFANVSKLEPEDLTVHIARQYGDSLNAQRDAQRMLGSREFLDNKQKIMSELTERYGEGNPFVTRLDEAGDNWKSVVETVGDADATILNRVNELERSIDGYVGAKSDGLPSELVSGITPDVLARRIGALAKSDPEIMGMLKQAAGSTGRTRLVDYLTTLKSADKIDDLMKTIVNSEALGHTAKNVKSSTFDPSNYVMATPNTFVEAGKKDALLKAAAESETGKLAKDIQEAVESGKVTIKQRTSETGIEQYYDMSNAPELFQRVEKTRESFQDLGLFQGLQLPFKNSAPSTDAFRALLNAEIDMIAQGKIASGKADALRASDVEQMPERMASIMVVPMEARSTIRLLAGSMKDYIANLVPGYGKTKNGPPQSVVQKQALRTLRDRLASMTRDLGTKMKRFKADPQFRAMLGGDENSSVEEMMGLLIVQRTGLDDPLSLEAVAESVQVVGEILFGMKTSRPDLLKGIFSRSYEITSTYLSASGQRKLKYLSERYAKAMTKTPLEHNRLLSQFVSEWTAALKADTTLIAGSDTFDSLAPLLNKDQAITNDIMVASYQAAEGRRIKNKVTLDLLATDTTMQASSFFQMADAKNIADRLRESFIEMRLFPDMGDEIDFERVYADAVRFRVMHQLEGKPMSLKDTFETLVQIVEHQYLKSADKALTPQQQAVAEGMEQQRRMSDTSDMDNFEYVDGAYQQKDPMEYVYWDHDTYMSMDFKQRQETLDSSLRGYDRYQEYLDKVEKAEDTFDDQIAMSREMGGANVNNFFTAISDLFSHVDGTAATIIRNNGMESQSSIQDVLNGFEEMFVTKADVADKSKIYEDIRTRFDEDVASYEKQMEEFNAKVKAGQKPERPVEPKPLDQRIAEQEIKAQRAQESIELIERLMLGSKAYDELSDLFSKNGYGAIKDHFLKLHKLKNWEALEVGTRVLQELQSLMYTVILGARPRFYGANHLTAPTIAYATTGYLTSPLPTVDRARKAATTLRVGEAAGSSIGATAGAFFSKIKAKIATDAVDIGPQGPSHMRYYETAVTDAAGRSYTYGDLWEKVIIGGGVRSGVGFQFSQAFVTEIMTALPAKSELKGLMGRAQKLYMQGKGGQQYLANVADTSDNFFRMQVAVQALEDGRSMEEAVELARRSMMDYGNLTQQERWIAANLFVFYTFTRQSLSMVAQNLTSVKGMSRLVNTLKGKRAFTTAMLGVAGKEQPEQLWLPDYTLSRPIQSIVNGTEKDIYYAGPPIPLVDATLLLTDLMQPREWPSIISGMLSPSLKLAFDTGEFYTRTDRLRPETAYWMNTLRTKAMLEVLLGGTIEAVPGTPEEGAVDGYVYPLDNSQERRYKAMTSALQFFGATTLSSDWATTVSGEKKGVEMGPAGRALYPIAATTPMSITRPETQRSRDIDARVREIDERIRELQASEDARLRRTR